MEATTDWIYALFGGGYSNTSPYYYKTVDTYDKNLAKGITTELTKQRYMLTATTLNKYALFGGGQNGSKNYHTVVEVYSCPEVKLSVYKGSKYKFQNMDKEETINTLLENVSIPVPVIGYIKIKNVTLS